MTPEQTMQEEKKNENTKPRYNKDTELSELMEGVIERPAGFSYKAGVQEVSELLEANNVKITDYPGENKPKEESTGTHKFTLDMKFKEGDKVKVKPNFKDNNIYEVCGFEYFTHARGQCSGIRYQMVDSEGECGHWAREDALELYKPKQPEAIPATEEEIQKVDKIINKVVKDMVHDNILFVVVKTKRLGSIYPEFYFDNTNKLDRIKDEDLIYDEQTKTWQDWGSK